MQLELTMQEATVLTQLIDMAIKAGGLAAAEAGVVLAKKINQAAEAEKAAAPEPTTAAPSATLAE